MKGNSKLKSEGAKAHTLALEPLGKERLVEKSALEGYSERSGYISKTRLPGLGSAVMFLLQCLHRGVFGKRSPAAVNQPW